MDKKSIITNKILIPFVAALVGAIIMLATVFLPYATATEDYAEVLGSYPDEIVYEELDMTAKDIMNISMVEYAIVYGNLSEQFWGDAAHGIMYVVLVALIGGFSLLAVLFAVLKKPIAVMIFDILAFGVFSLQNWDYTDRGVIPSSSYDWGAGYYIFYIAAVIVLVGAVWMLVTKIRTKRQLKAAENIL